MISTQKPVEFNPVFEVASCFVEREDGKILLVLRLPHKSEGNKWGVPAGKVEAGEQPQATIVRETQEETGITLERPRLFDTFHVRYPDYDFTYHIYHAVISSDTEVELARDEHQDFTWALPEEALKLNLVRHQDDCIRFFYFPKSG